MAAEELDDFGFPKYILEDSREVTGVNQQEHEVFINLLEQPAEVDKIRIILRCGMTIIIEELWMNGITTLSLQNEKGKRSFCVLDPNQTGFNACKVQAPVDIL